MPGDNHSHVKPASFLNSMMDNTTETKSNAIDIPKISLPKGGGALKNIDEKFTVNPSNGTASLSIPLPFSPNRNGFTPQLSLTYNSGTGNSLFGIGWNLPLTAIQRSTDKKLPQYADTTDVNLIEQEDSFMLSGMEELVAVTDKDNAIVQSTHNGFIVREYRPRIESGFSRIERIYHPDKGYYWRVTSRENITTWFGYSPACRLADPSHPERIFSWLPELSYDNKGSWILYTYKAEDLNGVTNEVYERNRFNKQALFVNQHLSSVQYGNTTAYYPDPNQPYDVQLPQDMSCCFELLLDYGEYNTLTPQPGNVQPWPSRKDPYSSFRAGFETRTYRLCKRALMFHHFPGLNGGTPTLVRSLDFDYTPSATQVNETNRPVEVTFLSAITSRGYIKKTDGNYSMKALPPVTFDYQWLSWDTSIRTVGNNSPDNNYQWVDLYNEGISGMLTEEADAWFYKANLGGDDKGQIQFTDPQPVIPKPALTGLSNSKLQLLDLDADGEKQLVVMSGGLQGYFGWSDSEEWQPFRAFIHTLNLNIKDPNIRMLDLNGDGRPEVLLSDQGAFLWWENAGKKGYNAPTLTTKQDDEEKGPTLIFADPENHIFLADMSGDGLTDLVRIRNGEIAYWPNMGYGRFGAKITMGNAPLFDQPELFNPAYILMADISGTGATDIIYAGRNKCRAYLNFSGNAWSDATEISPFFPTELPNKITAVDLFGTGTACIVWSSALPAYRREPMQYIDLMGGRKPHIMRRYENGLGKTINISYKSSTWYYLQDKLNGTPWITRLSFPVQCVSQTVTTESATRLRLSTQYSYHHGYYDHAEREFRGFGRVEQTDTEFFETVAKNNGDGAISQELHQAPILTKTWYHTGAYLDKENILQQYRQEYWYEIFSQKGFPVTPVEYTLPDAQLFTDTAVAPIQPEQLTAVEWRQVLRACKGMVLRQETFALDATDAGDVQQQKMQATPYSVVAHTCNIRLLQSQGSNRYAVFMTNEGESITYTYERNPEDPRIAHTLILKTDNLGNVLESVSVVYPRIGTETLLQDSPSDSTATRNAKSFGRTGQQKRWITLSRNDFTNDIIQPDNYLLRQGWQSRTYEITGLKPAGKIFTAAEFKDRDTWPEIPYQQQANGTTTQKRLTEHLKSKYYQEDLTQPAADGQLSFWGMRYEDYQLAYTPGLLQDIFSPDTAAPGVEVTPTDMQAGKFFQDDTCWWIRSGIKHYLGTGETTQTAQSRFFRPVAYTDAFNSKTEIFYDPLYIYQEHITDALGNESRVITFNFRTLSPVRVIDANDNITALITDELGLIKATSTEGKDHNNDQTGDEADNLEGYTELTDTTETAHISAFFQAAQVQDICNYAALQQAAKDILKNASGAMVYDFSTLPVVTATILREQHTKQNAASPLQISFEYSDGMGKVVMKKVQAEPGIAKKAVKQADGSWQITEVDTGTQLRWAGNGRTVLNNKGNPIKQYEPYFSVSPIYEDAAELVESGVTPVMYYDAVGRLVKTAFPNGTFTKVVFDAWRQLNYDTNDTVKDSDWYKSRITLPDSNPEKKTAVKTELHDNTPAGIILDSYGRPTLGIDHNRLQDDAGNIRDEFYYTFSELDAEGNIKSVTDARGNTVMQYRYDMLGHRVTSTGVDNGKRWLLNNVLGNPVKTWDERGHECSFTYDALHRPLTKNVKGGDGPIPLNHCYEKIIYGEGQPGDKQKNQRGKIAMVYDTAGKITYTAYDFKGNLLNTARTFTKDYKHVPDWNTATPQNLLEGSAYSFSTTTTYDALSRATKETMPDGSTSSSAYNPAGLLQQVARKHGTTTTTYVEHIGYDAKGQRTAIKYGNGVNTQYTYDPLTFRLTGIHAVKGTNITLQDLQYTYDPVGNISEMDDRAVLVVFFNNQKITGRNEYSYDALYRLAAANGRESDTPPYSFSPGDNWNDAPFIKQHAAGDPMAVRNYMQRYLYDPAGNLTQMKHVAGSSGSWTRDYSYENKSNRLKSVAIGSSVWQYPHHAQHGYITTLPNLQQLSWSFKEELQCSAAQLRIDGGTAETTYYVYDFNGQRVRKVTENQAAPGKTPTLKNQRLYFGHYELFKDEAGLERETLHITDKAQRIAMIDSETAIRKILGIPVGRTSPVITIRYQLANHLSSVSLELNEQAEVISYEEYHPYGTTSYQANNKAIKAAAKRYRYTNVERDEETGLEYHQARYYIPWLGRWLNTDPVGLKAGLNMYAYCMANPVSQSDVTGTDPRHDIGEVGELFTDQFLDKEGYYVFRDWSKKVNAGGIDSIAYNPKTKELYWIDNKAYTGEIKGASALEENFVKNRAAAIEFLKTQTGPEAAAALEAVGKNEVRLIANGMSGPEARASAGIFSRGMRFLDVYRRQIFSSMQGYLESTVAADVEALAAARALRMSKQGGFITVEGMSIIAIIGIGATVILLSRDKLAAAKQLAVSTAVDLTLMAIMMKVFKVGPGIAGLATMFLSMESDNAAFNEHNAKVRMINEFIFQNIPGVLNKYQYCDALVGWICTGWEYEAKDSDRYEKIFKALEYAIDHPYKLEPVNK